MGVRDRFDDWVVGRQFVPDCLHHPVSANRAFPIRRQIGRFCGDFRPLNSRVLVCVSVRAFEWRFLAPLSLHPKIPFPAGPSRQAVV